MAVRLLVGGMCAVVVTALLATAGCSSAEPEPLPPAPDSTASAPAPTTPPPTAQASAPPAGDVLLTDQGIGTVPFDSEPDAYARLNAVLGPPTRPLTTYCLGLADWAAWDGLGVYIAADGALLGWTLEDPPPARVRPPLDVFPAHSLAPVLDQGGQTELVAEDEFFVAAGDYRTTIGGYTWVSPGSDRDSPVTWVAVHPPGCA